MRRIDQETVQRIIDAADIVEVVSDFVKLRRSGANYKGLCPFHNERTPSFSVNKARNICKCFSCGKGGSPVNFIMEHEQLSYQEALRYLARKYNIEIVEKEQTDEERVLQNRREALFALNEFAIKTFEANLHDTSEGRSIALAYFRHRGVSDAMIARFHLGYAIDRSRAFIDAAVSAGFTMDVLVHTGLAGQSDRGGQTSYYDRYRSRVIFPIHSVSGRVVGFGARTMRSDKEVAKYVNSPESEIYHKNQELYGFYQAKNAIGKTDKCIMVEGYLDVISMHQSGMENVVASSGTSLTEGQIRAVRRFTDNVTLVYDADAAGIKASLRGIRLLLSEKMNVKVVSLPAGEDPDSFAQSHSASEVERYFSENEVDIIAFMARVLLSSVDVSDPTARAKVINVILETVACVDEPVKRQEYLTECSRLLDVSEQVLLRQLNIFITRRHEEEYKERQREKARSSLDNGQAAEQLPESGSDAQAEAGASAPLLTFSENRLEPYEKMLARYIVRYGMCYLFDLTAEDGSVVPGSVFDLISSELKIDGITFANKSYAGIVSIAAGLKSSWAAERSLFAARLDGECKAMIERKRSELAMKGGDMGSIVSAESKLVAEIESYRQDKLEEFDASYLREKLVNSDDDAVRPVANELVADRYNLSKIYDRMGGVESERDQLRILVPRAINELRAAIVGDMITQLTKELSTLPASSSERAAEIMQQICTYKEFQRKLVKALGERIILPVR